MCLGSQKIVIVLGLSREKLKSRAIDILLYDRCSVKANIYALRL